MASGKPRQLAKLAVAAVRVRWQPLHWIVPFKSLLGFGFVEGIILRPDVVNPLY